MTRALQSFTQGAWRDGGGGAKALRDAATGETVATIPRDGPDPAAMLAYARDVGGPQESIRLVDLADLNPSDVDMRCLLLIGSSATRVEQREAGAPVVFTPRRYLT